MITPIYQQDGLPAIALIAILRIAVSVNLCHRPQMLTLKVSVASRRQWPHVGRRESSTRFLADMEQHGASGLYEEEEIRHWDVYTRERSYLHCKFLSTEHAEA
jgi:hypothetical protein